MVSFKNWKDFYEFLQKYHNFSCLQCKHYKKHIEDDKEYTDFQYAHFFCPKTVSIVDFRFQVACPSWEDKKGRGLQDYDENAPVYNFSDEIVEKLNEMTEVSIENIEKLIKQEDKE